MRDAVNPAPTRALPRRGTSTPGAPPAVGPGGRPSSMAAATSPRHAASRPASIGRGGRDPATLEPWSGVPAARRPPIPARAPAAGPTCGCWLTATTSMVAHRLGARGTASGPDRRTSTVRGRVPAGRPANAGERPVADGALAACGDGAPPAASCPRAPSATRPGTPIAGSASGSAGMAARAGSTGSGTSTGTDTGRRAGSGAALGRRQEVHWIPVRVARAGVAHAEVKVGLRSGAPARRADGPERVAGRDAVAGAHADRRQVQVRGVEAAVRGANRDGQARRPGEPSERDRAADRGDHRRTRRSRDVDPPVLSARVRIGSVPVRRNHLARYGPAPVGGRRAGGRDEEDEAR